MKMNMNRVTQSILFVYIPKKVLCDALYIICIGGKFVFHQKLYTTILYTVYTLYWDGEEKHPQTFSKQKMNENKKKNK